MYMLVTQNPSSLVRGTSWLIQLWLFLYFLELRIDETRQLKDNVPLKIAIAAYECKLTQVEVQIHFQAL